MSGLRRGHCPAARDRRVLAYVFIRTSSPRLLAPAPPASSPACSASTALAMLPRARLRACPDLLGAPRGCQTAPPRTFRPARFRPTPPSAEPITSPHARSATAPDQRTRDHLPARRRSTRRPRRGDDLHPRPETRPETQSHTKGGRRISAHVTDPEPPYPQESAVE